MKSFKEFSILQRYNDSLNPLLWDENDKLRPEIKDKLIQITKQFMQFSNIDFDEAEDIIFTGSNANFNYINNISDIDIHPVLKFEKIFPGYDKELIGDYLFDKKVLWGNKHTGIRVKGNPVELYFQPYNEYLDYIAPNQYNRGVYSLKTDEWLSKPSHNPFKVNDPAMIRKLKYTMTRIDNLLGKGEYQKISDLKKRILASRGVGLRNSGEGSTENIVYKEIRARGYIDKINKALQDHQDSLWSL